MNQMLNSTKKPHAQFNWQDPFLIEQQLTSEERMIRDAAQAYAQDKLMPRVLQQFRHEQTDASIFREMVILSLMYDQISPSAPSSEPAYARPQKSTVSRTNKITFALFVLKSAAVLDFFSLRPIFKESSIITPCRFEFT